jgi:hypothetical protein
MRKRAELPLVARSGIELKKARQQFFFEKKNQKTFTLLVDAAGNIGACRGEKKLFGSFFQKRTAFFALASLCRPFASFRFGE